MNNLGVVLVTARISPGNIGMETHPVSDMPALLQRIEEVLGAKLDVDSKKRAGMLMDGKVHEVFKKGIYSYLPEASFSAENGKAITGYLTTIGKPAQ